MPGTVNGFTVAYTAIGGVLLLSGIKNASISETFRALLKNKEPAINAGEPVIPANQTTAADISIGQSSGGTNVPGAVTSIENYGLAQLVAGTYGWAGGKEFAALTNVINAESGGNPNATNPGSGAYGIAQALGHGEGAATQGSVTNQYGGYGVPNSTARAANSGNASAQLVWMMAYIKSRWGDPIGAWANEQSAHWY